MWTLYVLVIDFETGAHSDHAIGPLPMPPALARRQGAKKKPGYRASPKAESCEVVRLLFPRQGVAQTKIRRLLCVKLRHEGQQQIKNNDAANPHTMR